LATNLNYGHDPFGGAGGKSLVSFFQLFDEQWTNFYFKLFFG
jgi:hypothetical protein